MSQTKKLLVAFNPERPEDPSSDFLIPFQTEGRTNLYGLKSGRDHTYGLMIYLGRAITENDLFSKLVDSGAKIESAEEGVLATLRQYVEKLQSLRIGNVVRLQSIGDGFELELVAKTPSGFRR
jgi:hypothetical protein